MTVTSLFTDTAGNIPFLTFMHDMGAFQGEEDVEKQSDLSASLLGLVRSGQTCRNKSESVSRSVLFLSLGPHGLYTPDSSVHGILQARILEWVAIRFSRGSSGPRNQNWVSHSAGRFFTI